MYEHDSCAVRVVRESQRRRGERQREGIVESDEDGEDEEDEIDKDEVSRTSSPVAQGPELPQSEGNVPPPTENEVLLPVPENKPSVIEEDKPQHSPSRQEQLRVLRFDIPRWIQSKCEILGIMSLIVGLHLNKI
jgi:hypothetical protein